MNAKTMVYLMSEDVTDDSGSMHQFFPQMPGGSASDVAGKLNVPSGARGTN